VEMEDIQRVYREHGLIVAGHAARRMKERHILREEIVETIEHGEIIEAYLREEPLPRYLILKCICDGKPLHVLFGASETELDLITAYRPDPMKWDDTFRYRR